MKIRCFFLGKERARIARESECGGGRLGFVSERCLFIVNFNKLKVFFGFIIFCTEVIVFFFYYGFKVGRRGDF